jgi:hypothetical protein
MESKALALADGVQSFSFGRTPEYSETQWRGTPIARINELNKILYYNESM